VASDAAEQSFVRRFRNAEAVHALSRALFELKPERPVCLMHVCGTHENALCQFGLRDLLPPWLRLIAGPGCPVCICPAADIDMAVRLMLDHHAVVASYGDVVRVPARMSLAEAKSVGGDCRVVYGIDDAIGIAESEPASEVVFFAVGFETTACTTAAVLQRSLPKNFSILCSHRVVPPALEALLRMEGPGLDGFILPGHVTTVAGLQDYRALSRKCGIPMTVAGFEPADIMLAVLDLAKRAINKEAGVYNAYSRAVREEGNIHARRAMDEVFDTYDAPWRGIGAIAGSGLRIRAGLRDHDAMVRFGLRPDPAVPETQPGCRCGEIMLGRVEPEDCSLFAATCAPDHPVGPCMVAFEGTCHARFRHAGVTSARPSRRQTA
jgi:hydrogenase expression/formation protein HypD